VIFPTADKMCLYDFVTHGLAPVNARFFYSSC
jgi:hypothetical protein